MLLIYLAMLETAEERTKFEQLYMLHLKRMHAVAYDVLRNQQDAEDAVHEAFISLTKCLDGVEELDSPKTRSFLSVIAESKAIDIYRVKQKKSHVPLDEMVERIPDVSQIQALENASDLAKAIAMLPASYRELILLRYDNGFSEREVGEICGMTESNTHKKIQRARKKLRIILEEMEAEV